jgi:hypothetical protein
MSIDCQWVEKNIEALFCDRLSDQESRLARTHIDNCAECRKEVAALNAIDPLVKRYFQQEMSLARAPRRTRVSMIYGTAAAAVLAAAMLFAAVTLRTPQVNIVSPPPPVVSQSAEAVPVPAPPIIKTDTETVTDRAKPTPAPPVDALPPARVVVPGKDAPDFLVADPAGYLNRLEDYRGYVAVIGVWSTDQQESAASLDRLYKEFSSNTRLRFVGVTNERGARAANTTFPIVYNQGSKLLDLKSGQFVLVDERGSIELRGSLVEDFENLRQALQGK